MDYGEIVEFLIHSGLPEQMKDNVSILENGSVLIRDLDNTVCLQLIGCINGQLFKGKRIYCNGIIAVTPQKEPKSPIEAPASTNTDQLLDSVPNVETSNLIGTQNDIPKILSPLTSPNWPTFERSDLARRHSLSLLNRMPPPGSLAQELLAPSPTLRNCPSKSQLLSSIKDITGSLSEFNSCISSSNEESDKETFLPNKHDIKKRKRKKSPVLKEQSKKADLKVTPDKII